MLHPWVNEDEDTVSCSRTQCSDSSEAQTRNLSILSHTLYYCATARSSHLKIYKSQSDLYHMKLGGRLHEPKRLKSGKYDNFSRVNILHPISSEFLSVV